MRCLNGLDGMRQIALVARNQNGLGTFCCKGLRNGQANAFGATGDEDAVSCEF